MTVATVKAVVKIFLMSEVPEVLALKGAWGVGKTFAWNQLVEESKDDIKLSNYCYVSLFGISSIKELRTTIFVKTKPIDAAAWSAEAGYKKGINYFLERWRPLLRWISNFRDIPYLKNNISVALESMAPYFIRNTIICFDDFERLNTDLIKPDEILGIISELKTEKDCKIVLIFNEDKLKSKPVYEMYREKVIDIELLFAPTTDEAAQLALASNTPCYEAIKRHTASLGITNIRVLRKIVQLTELINGEIGGLHPDVMQRAVMTLSLFAWSYYDSDEKKPTPEFIIDWHRTVWGFRTRAGEESNPQHTAWAEILRGYGLSHMDEFDQTIYKVIQHGYLDETGFLEHAIKLDSFIRATELLIRPSNRFMRRI